MLWSKWLQLNVQQACRVLVKMGQSIDGCTETLAINQHISTDAHGGWCHVKDRSSFQPLRGATFLAASILSDPSLSGITNYSERKVTKEKDMMSLNLSPPLSNYTAWAGDNHRPLTSPPGHPGHLDSRVYIKVLSGAEGKPKSTAALQELLSQTHTEAQPQTEPEGHRW